MQTSGPWDPWLPVGKQPTFRTARAQRTVRPLRHAFPLDKGGIRAMNSFKCCSNRQVHSGEGGGQECTTGTPSPHKNKT